MHAPNTPSLVHTAVTALQGLKAKLKAFWAGLHKRCGWSLGRSVPCHVVARPYCAKQHYSAVHSSYTHLIKVINKVRASPSPPLSHVTCHRTQTTIRQVDQALLPALSVSLESSLELPLIWLGVPKKKPMATTWSISVSVGSELDH